MQVGEGMLSTTLLTICVRTAIHSREKRASVQQPPSLPYPHPPPSSINSSASALARPVTVTNAGVPPPGPGPPSTKTGEPPGWTAQQGRSFRQHEMSVRACATAPCTWRRQIEHDLRLTGNCHQLLSQAITSDLVCRWRARSDR